MKKILVAEDDHFLANAYRVKLTKAGYEVSIALDGKETLALMASFQPDLVLLDLVMPTMDGFSVLEELQKKKNQIPVIVASNLGQQEDIDKAMKLGAVDYIIKSNESLEFILGKIKQHLP